LKFPDKLIKLLTVTNLVVTEPEIKFLKTSSTVWVSVPEAICTDYVKSAVIYFFLILSYV
jgi:hypothetical protein